MKSIDFSLWHKWWDGVKWSIWIKIEGSITSAPTAMWRQGGLDVYARGEDQQLWKISYDYNGGIWSRWECIGGILN